MAGAHPHLDPTSCEGNGGGSKRGRLGHPKTNGKMGPNANARMGGEEADLSQDRRDRGKGKIINHRVR